jgi:hypothetical protein
LRYPFHTLCTLLALAAMIATAVFDDLIYPLDDGLISIGLVFVFTALLGTLIARAKRDGDRAGPVAPGKGARPHP